MPSGSWIAVHHSLMMHPKMKKIHRLTNASSVAETIGRLALVWIMADMHSDNGEFVGTVEDIDNAAEVDGFGQAMIEAGWLVVEGDTLTLPKFGDVNGKTAKRRLIDTRRKSQKRQNKHDTGDVSATVRTKSANLGQSADYRTEQNKTEQNKSKSKTPPSPQRGGDTSGFDDWWAIYPSRNGRKGNKGEARNEWAKIPPMARAEVMTATRNLAAAVIANGTYPKDAQRFLRPPNKRADADPAYIEWVGAESPNTRQNDSLSMDNGVLAKLNRKTSSQQAAGTP